MTIMTPLRKFAFSCLCCALLASMTLAACGGKQTSSIENTDSASAVWSGSEENMLLTMRAVCAQYATADPLEAPDKGFAITYYGHFRILAELLPLNPPPAATDEDGAELPPQGPVSGDYGLRVTFDKGLDRYEELVDKIYADLVRDFDANFSRR